MIVLNQAHPDEITQFGQTLYQMRDNAAIRTLEEASQISANAIYDEFRQPNGGSAFALVRIYRLCSTHELASDVQQFVGSSAERLWMALIGTMGDETAWCDRHMSKDHKAIPAGDDQGPMLRAAFNQLGVEFVKTHGKDTLEFKEASFLTNYFHVADALGSPNIPAQDGFVRPYKIKSVVGLGSTFVSHSLYLALCFSKVAISSEDAQKFAQLSPYLSTLLAVFDGRGKIWN